jgi:DNA invertase Pin-like site-specific DNA recombinase
MKKFVAYYRVSTQKQSLGIDAQRTSVLNYINSTNGILVCEHVEKESGKNNQRIELNEAIKCAKREAATLVIAKLDRLSRNVSFIFQLRDANVDFLALDLPTCNTLTLSIFAALAQHEREIVSSRTKAALMELKKKGKKLGSPKATFSSEMRNKAIEIRHNNANVNENNLRAKCVIESLKKEGKNNSEIARYLNSNNFRTSKGLEFQSIQVDRIIKRYNLK